MIKPLSPLKYFKENKKKTVVVFVTLFFAVLCISFLTCTVKSIFKSAKDTNIAPLSKFSWVSAPKGDMFIDKNEITKISNLNTTDSIYHVMLSNTSVATLFGNTSAPILFINRDKDLQEVFDKTELTLINGRMPKIGEYEIMMHSNILKNKKLSIGDKFGDEVDSSEWISGTYTIVGEFTGESVIGFATKNYYLKGLEDSGVNIDENTLFAVVFPKDNDLQAMNRELEKIDKRRAYVTTRSFILEDFDEQMKSINTIMTVIIFIITFGMSIAVGALIYTFYNARNSEFGIIYAIGYSKKNVKQLVYKELFFISFFSWLIGYIASIGVLKIVDITMFRPLGQKAILFSVYGFLYTLIVPILVFLCTMFPITRSLSKKDLVTIIERRE